MAGRPGGNLLYIHSDVMRGVCATFSNTPFSYAQASNHYPDYTQHLHRKLIAHDLITKHSDGYVKRNGYTTHMNYYKATPKLLKWYDMNFVSLTGKGKLATMERLIRGMDV